MNPTGKIIIENKIYQGFAEKSNLEIGMTVKVVGIKDKVVLKVERYIKTPELPKKKINNDYFLN